MLSFFPRGVLDEILNLIESVFEDFPSYSFMKIEFDKGLDAIYISNILNHKDVKVPIPPHFKNQSPPLISYSHLPPTANKFLITGMCCGVKDKYSLLNRTHPP